MRSRAGLKAVSLSLGVLGAAALLQAGVLVLTGSVALLADLIHNVGDALTAVPVGIAFLLRSFRAEKIAGLAVVLAILVSACVALYESIERLVSPQELSHVWALAAAGLVGFVGNELAAQIRLRAGKRLSSPALTADGNHARVDGFVSLGVVASAIVVALGAPIGDPIIGLLITAVILKITWDSWRTVSATEPGEPVGARAGGHMIEQQHSRRRVRLCEVRDDELPAWLDSMRRFYVDDLERHGGLTRDEAQAKSDRDHGALFPGGKPAPGNHLYILEDENGDPIGRLWFGERPFGVWLYAIELDERVRGRGLGRAAMLAFEEHARELGARKVALNVFGGNSVARSLYASLGYLEEAVQMSKQLE